MARVRLNGQNASHSTRTLLDGNGTQSQAVELIPSEPAGETETLAVVVNYQNDATVVLRQFYHDMGSLRMLFYVVECFTVNLENLAADAVGSMEVGGFDHDVKGQGGLVAVALGETMHEVDKIGALDAEGTQVGDHAAELGGLVFYRVLEVAEAGFGLIGGGRDLTAEDVELDFDAEEGLEYAVVEVAGDAAAFAFNGAGPKMAEEEHVFEGGADMASDAFEPGEVRALEGFAAVDQEEAPGGLAELVEGHGKHGAHAELLLGGAGKAREGAKAAAVAAVPSEAAACAFEAVPADSSVHIVEEEAVGAGQGVTLGDEALALAGLEAPEIDAFEIGVAIGEECDLDVERSGEFVKKQPQGFGEALIYLERCGDAGEE